MRDDSFREIVDLSRHAVERIRPHHEQFLAREQPGETEGAHDFGCHRRFNEAPAGGWDAIRTRATVPAQRYLRDRRLN